MTVRGLVGALDVSHRASSPEDRAVLPHEGIHPAQADSLADRMTQLALNPAPILLVHRAPAQVRALVRDGRGRASRPTSSSTARAAAPDLGDPRPRDPGRAGRRTGRLPGADRRRSPPLRGLPADAGPQPGRRVRPRPGDAGRPGGHPAVPRPDPPGPHRRRARRPRRRGRDRRRRVRRRRPRGRARSARTADPGRHRRPDWGDPQARPPAGPGRGRGPARRRGPGAAPRAHAGSTTTTPSTPRSTSCAAPAAWRC